MIVGQGMEAVATLGGRKRIEDLAVGDAIVDALTGHVGQVTDVLSREVSFQAGQVQLFPGLHPVRIARDAFGPGRPAQDVLVSPGQEVLIAEPPSARRRVAALRQVAVSDLVGQPGVARIADPAPCRYFAIFTEGCTVLDVAGLAVVAFAPAAFARAKLLSKGRGARLLAEAQGQR
jgi:hypothetical protein